MKRKNILILLFSFICLVVSIPTYAQGGGRNGGDDHRGGGDDHRGDDYDHGTSVPIDNGIIYLLSAGVLLGASIIYKKSKSNKEITNKNESFISLK
ncbi:MAG: hypothetical protein KKG25_06835 [Bacteroidetes bacterium]|nr:hypothetical protein [Bacteroidota bacterium]MBU1484557.1 hypothetical protein [Bacteroidota bacterium]MBU2267706.1 hypothetical protein [Bacteroidota bacterium]MBU2374416.1 hypothetical protein [Bacteroidota bacterium]